MKIAIPKYNAIETIVFIILLFMTVFNSEKYGVVFAKVCIPIILFIFYSSMKQNILKRIKVNLVIGFVWCLAFILSSLVFYKNNYVDIQTLIVICFFIFFGCLFLDVNFDVTQIKLIFNTYVFCSFIISLNIIINYLTGNFYRDKRATFEIFDVNKDPNYMAALIVPAIFIVLIDIFYKHKIEYKIMLTILNVILITALVMTGSRGSFVAVVAAVGVYIILQMLDTDISSSYKVLIILGIIVSAVFISFLLLYSTNRLLDFSSYGTDIRLSIWKYALSFWRTSPLIGHGAGSTSNYTLFGIYSFATHNCFIDVLGDSGVLGGLCFLFILRNIIRSSADKKKTLSFVILCFMPLMFINGFYTLNFWIMLCLAKLYSDYTMLESPQNILKHKLKSIHI